jgi:hypothetical protein
MDEYNNRPTFRPTYRRSYSTGQYDPYAPPTIGTYVPPTPYNPYTPTTPYNPYAPPTPYSPNNPYSPPTWQGDSYKGAEPSPWKGDAYKKYKTNKPTASPTQSSAPTKSPRPSMTPSVSSAPSVSSKPSVSLILVHVFDRCIATFCFLILAVLFILACTESEQAPPWNLRY